MTYHSNKDIHKECCQKESYYMENKENEGTPIVGKVTGLLLVVTPTRPIRLPLTTVLFKTPGIKIPQDGGITVQEDGEYFISFDGAFTPDTTTLPANPFYIFSVFTPNFSGTALVGAGTATLAELVCLRAGDTVYVTVTSNATLTSATGILVVAKVED
ncbi:TNF domain-containing protein [Priestia megaterium]